MFRALRQWLKQSNPNQSSPATPMLKVEALEDRTVPSAFIRDGILHVHGTAANDIIRVIETEADYQVIIWNNEEYYNRRFSKSRVTAGRVQIEGYAGHDEIRLNLLRSLRGTVNGGDGNDQLIGTRNNDVLNGGNGDDYILGGAGNDIISGENGDNVLDGQAGNDLIVGGRDMDDIYGREGNDVLFGGEGNDELYGGDGDDRLYGGGGSDVLRGENGNDFLQSGPNSNLLGSVLSGGSGNDRLVSRSRNDFLFGNAGHDSANLLANTFVRHCEVVWISVPGGSPQTDNWSCGPNSASRFLRAYGIEVSYETLRSVAASWPDLVSQSNLGTRPGSLRDMIANYRPETQLATGASFETVVNLLRQGRPVIALVASGILSDFLGKVGILHYVVLNGIDEATQTLYYMDTDGVQRSWSYAEFQDRWNWGGSWFTGLAGDAAQGFLNSLGVHERTIIF
ncbi:C39 family peptidase [Thermogemmata fonticola]|uniref:C39 family peptidase n=1 Tax=Thermogemmata fonticola TaxID=2755323 RepID=A0A7V8VFI0_9BACT|nr:C39 family peptidase [Thermogemmata fonticola]MBA2227083.1 C39 family peptidase [Thermogemmata fonticola]